MFYEPLLSFITSLALPSTMEMTHTREGLLLWPGNQRAEGKDQAAANPQRTHNTTKEFMFAVCRKPRMFGNPL